MEIESTGFLSLFATLDLGSPKPKVWVEKMFPWGEQKDSMDAVLFLYQTQKKKVFDCCDIVPK
jgi:hypothetical protein